MGKRSIDYPLIEAAKKDSAHFAPLYQKYFKQIFLYIFKKIQNEEITNDIASQVFLKAMLNINKYEDRGYPFSSWLYTIAGNEVNLHFRKLKKNPEVEIQEKDVVSLLDDFNELPDENHQELLVKAMNHLSERDMEIIDLRYFEKLSFIEIGNILGITDNNAKIRLYRSVEMLRKTYKKLEVEEEI